MRSERESQYISGLKESSGLSWADLEEKTGWPSSTIRDHLSGRVAKPNPTIMRDTLEAMGGSAAEMRAFHPQTSQDSADSRSYDADSQTISNLKHIRVEMLDAQRDAYESQIQQMQEAHERQIAQMMESHARELRSLKEADRFKTRLIRILAISLAAVVAFVFFMLVYDITQNDAGWIQSVFDVGSSVSSGLHL